MKLFTILLSAFVLLSTLSPAQSVTPVAANGQLKVVGRQLTNQAGKAIQLRGMSSHGLQYFPNCFNASSVQALARDWGIDVFRSAMYVDEGGYVTDKARYRTFIDNLVDWTGQNGVYNIIDWHILNPGNPNDHLADAKEFFQIEAQKHAGKKHVIYEICNEPHDVDWNTIKGYAEQIIPIIRTYDSQAIILVGTPNYSGTPGDVRSNPLTGANAYNVMYTFHFYAGSHYTESYIDDVLKTVPLFISEWGTSNYSGNGGNDYANSQTWLNLLAGGNSSGIKVSWCNWNFSDNSETSAALNPGSCNSQAWNNTSTSGTWVKDHILNPADDFGPSTVTPSVAITSPATSTTVGVGSNVVITATVSNTTATSVDFYNGATRLGGATTTPYSYTIANIQSGTYSITAKANLSSGGPLVSSPVQITATTASNPPPTNTTDDVIGPTCVVANDVKTYSVNANDLPNATGFSWWCTGSTQSIAQNGSQATINFGPSFSGGQVCVGVNYSVAPWYKQFCKNVTVCTSTPPPPPTPTNQAPTVALTSPTNSATFTAPATINLTASASDPDGSIAKVEFFNGSTKLGESTSAPYQYVWSNVSANTYTLTAKATDNQGATTTSGAITIQIKAAPSTSTADVIGPDCVRANDVVVYEVNSRNLTNATSFSWWCQGATQSITPGPAGKATYNFGPYYTGGQVCVGINYNGAPYYQQFCKNVSVCAPGARISATDVADNLVFPNPSSRQFTFVAERDIQAMSVADQVGRERLKLGAAKAGQTVTFGEQLPAGTYLLQILYEGQPRRTVKLLKVDN